MRYGTHYGFGHSGIHGDLRSLDYLADNASMSVVDLHPQRQEIIEGLMAGETARSLSRRVNPPISHGTLAVFKKAVLMSMARGLKPNGLGVNVLKDTILADHSNGLDKPAAERVMDSLRVETQALVRNKLARQDRWINLAEQRPMRDADGNVMLDAAGQQLMEPDHRALAAHDRNQTSDLDLLARLGQLYQEAGESGPGLTAVMSFGDVNVYIGAQPQTAQAPQVIEVECEPLDVGIVRAGNKR